ncbi:MAG: L-asparaginase [Acidobacteria bacterium]|nr:MAG: L-asparaginase [Acidobacteriota bacterium]
METPILSKVIRGETVESVHRGHLVVLTGGGEVLLSEGDPQTVTYFRSASKPFQALPFITSGAADEFGFSEDEIALACASHSGEPMHFEIAARMLEKVGLKESDLQCGVHLPFNETESERLLRANAEINQLYNNCSGKHAAMLAFARRINADTDRYLLSQSPVQQAIQKTISIFCEVPTEGIAIGIDGCCAPNFALPLSAMARGFLNLVAPRDDFADDVVRSAAARVVSAMLNHPELIGGSERLDTMLMKAASRKLISKVGADGVWLCGIMPSDQFPKGAAIAVKIEDGDDKRARPVVAVKVLKQLGILSSDALPELSPMPIKNRRGDIVGRVEAVLTP